MSSNNSSNNNNNSSTSEISDAALLDEILQEQGIQLIQTPTQMIASSNLPTNSSNYFCHICKKKISSPYIDENKDPHCPFCQGTTLHSPAALNFIQKFIIFDFFLIF